MRIRQTIIIPAVLALGVIGSALSGPAMSVAGHLASAAGSSVTVKSVPAAAAASGACPAMTYN